MKVPLDWLGFHYYTRRVVSHSVGDSQPGMEATSAPKPKEKEARRAATP